MKKKHVEYEMGLVTYVDILGFRELIRTKTAGEISRTIRVVKEAVQPHQSKFGFKKKLSGVPDVDYVNFSDLSIVSTPVRRPKALPLGSLVYQLIRLVHAQAILIADEGILIRGGITVGKLVKSWGQLFGPAIVRAYEIESKIAKSPRIVVGKEVFEELAINSGLWVHDRETEQESVRDLLRQDEDGELFIDYLRIIRNELDDPGSDYEIFLNRHREIIKRGLVRYARRPKIRKKYEWMERYHRATLARLNAAAKTDAVDHIARKK
ncbi:MAG TPA: hypothetical protein VGZ48_04640 [Candidatus Acidoferrales bacterium]|jgi:hypothetical protein|nr:hypothetical protein [Candidatus Acidoferrales bacterium]